MEWQGFENGTHDLLACEAGDAGTADRKRFVRHGGSSPDSQAGLRAAQAVDAVAGTTTAVVAASVRDGGEILVYGALAGFSLELGVADLLFRGVRIHGFWCAPRAFGASECYARMASGADHVGRPAQGGEAVFVPQVEQQQATALCQAASADEGVWGTG